MSTEELNHFTKVATVLAKLRKKLRFYSYVGLAHQKNMHEEFKKFDSKETGIVSDIEFRKVLCRIVRITAHELEVVPKIFDLLGNGICSYVDFISYMEHIDTQQNSEDEYIEQNVVRENFESTNKKVDNNGTKFDSYSDSDSIVSNYNSDYGSVSDTIIYNETSDDDRENFEKSNFAFLEERISLMHQQINSMQARISSIAYVLS